MIVWSVYVLQFPCTPPLGLSTEHRSEVYLEPELESAEECRASGGLSPPSVMEGLGCFSPQQAVNYTCHQKKHKRQTTKDLNRYVARAQLHS